jgi:AraC family transcriptional regulator of adaptative response/methylated-DNA-[protein]-cysteine methyltransferase
MNEIQCDPKGARIGWPGAGFSWDNEAMLLQRLSQAVLYAAGHYQEQPTLKSMAQVAGLSPAHFQRSFQRSVGISPKSFVQHLTAESASASLRKGRSVLDSALDSGLSGPGRLHDLIIQVEGATPGEVASQGEGMELQTAILPTACGSLFAAKATRGLAFAAFTDSPSTLRRAKAELSRLWPKARFKENAASVQRAMQFNGKDPLRCWVAGTPFQLQVWRALVRLPAGRSISYRGLASLAHLKGPRAIGGAVAANPIAILIPCHRVIQSSGALGNYHWGQDRKRALLALEGAGSLALP